MSISNRTLLIAVSITLAATFIGMFLSISSFSSFYSAKQLPSTGYASSTQGNITLVIAKEISITTIDSEVIDFGGCKAGSIIYSNVSGGNADGDCSGFTATSIIVRNTGAFPVNITINATDRGEAHGGTFLNATTDDSWLAFKVRNASSHFVYDGGCTGFYSDWTNITNNVPYRGCDNLAANAYNNSMSFDIAIFIPNSTQGGNESVDFTFWAYQI